jgi:CubicO group peptidase (beta-lactamase class C family)
VVFPCYTAIMDSIKFPSLSRTVYSLMVFFLAISLMSGCAPSSGGEEVDYAPLERNDWPVSTPEGQGLKSALIDRFYRDAGEQDTLYSLLVIKNGNLIAEKYFNGGSVNKRADLASVTKSFTSALMGIALNECDLDSLDQKMVEFFPEYVDQLEDPRKREITLEQMIQMRSGYPWEEFTPPRLSELFSSPNWIPHLVDFSLTSDPGTEFGYSNLTAHLAGVVIAKACGKNLITLAEDHIFDPIEGQMATWPSDPSGYNYGSGALALTARDAARFGLLYLNGGEYQNKQVIPAAWVESSLDRYSTGIYGEGLGRYLRDLGYGYFWWSATSGTHDFNYAWGHGGNLIVLIHDLDMVIVTTADILNGYSGDESWEKEGAIIDMVGKFIKSLPAK